MMLLDLYLRWRYQVTVILEVSVNVQTAFADKITNKRAKIALRFF